MYQMFKKVNAKERIVGWYHTGPKLHQNDIKINDKIREYCPQSVLVIIDAEPKTVGLPTEAYRAVEEVHDDGTPTTKTFEHVASEIGAEEAEEVGVEHLLRDIKDTTVGTLSQQITNQLLGLKGLNGKLRDMVSYLEQVNFNGLRARFQGLTKLPYVHCTMNYGIYNILGCGWENAYESSNHVFASRYLQFGAGFNDNKFCEIYQREYKRSNVGYLRSFPY